jgi:hypothetical protein
LDPVPEEFLFVKVITIGAVQVTQGSNRLDQSSCNPGPGSMHGILERDGFSGVIGHGAGVLSVCFKLGFFTATSVPEGSTEWFRVSAGVHPGK